MTTKLSSKCSLDSYKLELLGKELKQPIQVVEFEVCIDFSAGTADGNLTRLIATELIASASVISKLDLSNNPIQRGEDGLSHLCQALTTNTSLVELNLSIFKLSNHRREWPSSKSHVEDKQDTEHTHVIK